MAVLRRLCLWLALGAAAAAESTIPAWGYEPPKASKRNLRKSVDDPEHASKKTYPPAPAPGTEGGLDVWRPRARRAANHL